MINTQLFEALQRLKKLEETKEWFYSSIGIQDDKNLEIFLALDAAFRREKLFIKNNAQPWLEHDYFKRLIAEHPHFEHWQRIRGT